MAASRGSATDEHGLITDQIRNQSASICVLLPILAAAIHSTALTTGEFIVVYILISALLPTLLATLLSTSLLATLLTTLT